MNFKLQFLKKFNRLGEISRGKLEGKPENELTDPVNKIDAIKNMIDLGLPPEKTV